MATTTANLSLIKPEATDNITPTIFAENFEKIDSNVVTTYTHTRSGTVHNFVGKGATGKAKITASFVAGDTFAVNGVAVNAYVGADAPDGDTIANGRWVMFVYDGTQLNFKGGGGVGSTKLAAATATAAQVLSGKTFYSGDKTLKTGTIDSKGADSVTLDASTTSYTFGTSGKYCTGNMTVSTSTKGAESVTLNPGGSYTFATSGKLCTGNMAVSARPGVLAGTVITVNWFAWNNQQGRPTSECAGGGNVRFTINGHEVYIAFQTGNRLNSDASGTTTFTV